MIYYIKYEGSNKIKYVESFNNIGLGIKATSIKKNALTFNTFNGALEILSKYLPDLGNRYYIVDNKNVVLVYFLGKYDLDNCGKFGQSILYFLIQNQTLSEKIFNILVDKYGNSIIRYMHNIEKYIYNKYKQ